MLLHERTKHYIIHISTKDTEQLDLSHNYSVYLLLENPICVSNLTFKTDCPCCNLQTIKLNCV